MRNLINRRCSNFQSRFNLTAVEVRIWMSYYTPLTTRDICIQPHIALVWKGEVAKGRLWILSLVYITRNGNSERFVQKLIQTNNREIIEA